MRKQLSVARQRLVATLQGITLLVISGLVPGIARSPVPDPPAAALTGTHLLWSAAGAPTPQAKQLIETLREVARLGLRPADYPLDLEPGEQLSLRSGASLSTQQQAHFDQVLTQAAMRLITHLHYGRVNPTAVGFELPRRRNDLDLDSSVAALASATQISEALEAIEPQFYHYALLKSALARYRDLALIPSLTQLPDPGRHALHVGDRYVGAQALRALLQALGDLPGSGDPASADQQQLDPTLVDALQRFQRRHGLPVDGALGKQTFAALTIPLSKRVQQIELTLERWRWLPDFTTPPIVVNIPQFQLFAFQSTRDRVADILQMPVIVGQTYPSKRTPVFIGDLAYVVFRPYWDVPRSILLQEMLPQIRLHGDYLQRNNLEIVSGQGDDAVVVSPSAQSIAALTTGQLRLRQRPGDDNALGLIKFVFPNAHNVYMHGTPAHQLFFQSRRAFSHGCIRLSDVVGLAIHVLRNAAEPWTRERIESAMRGATSMRVELRQPIRVMVLYATVLATEAGPIQFYDDIYGHDRRLAALLDRGSWPGGVQLAPKRVPAAPP